MSGSGEARIAFDLWVVYDHPADARDAYLVRRWEVSGRGPVPTHETVTYHTLDRLRAEMRDRGLTRLPPSRRDDKVILESLALILGGGACKSRGGGTCRFHPDCSL